MSVARAAEEPGFRSAASTSWRNPAFSCVASWSATMRMRRSMAPALFEIFGLSAEQRYPTGGVVLLTSMVLPDAVFLCMPGAVVLKRYGVLRPIEVGRHGPVLGEPVDVLRPAERLVVLEGGEGDAAQACWEAHSHGKQALGGGGRAGRHESGRPSRLTHPACAGNFGKRLFELECRTEGVNAPRTVSSRGIGRVPPVGAAEL